MPITTNDLDFVRSVFDEGLNLNLTARTAILRAVLALIGRRVGAPWPMATSGSRTRADTNRLLARFENGDPSIIVRPVRGGQHEKGNAWDMGGSFQILDFYGRIWSEIFRLTWGGLFSTPDIVHFDSRPRKVFA